MKVNGKMIKCKDMENFIMLVGHLLIKDCGKKVVSVELDRFSMINRINLMNLLTSKTSHKLRING